MSTPSTPEWNRFPRVSLEKNSPRLIRGLRSCQRKVEMSGFPPGRNVRLQGFLQGCSGGTWYFAGCQTAARCVPLPGDCGCNPFDSQFPQSASELRESFFSTQLFLECSGATAMAKNAVLIGVMRQRTSIALQPASECAQVFFGAVVLELSGSLMRTVVNAGPIRLVDGSHYTHSHTQVQ